MKTILCVDDSMTIRFRVTKALGPGYNTHRVADGYEALNLIIEGLSGIDLFLIDVNMPNMDGIELLRNIREKLHMDTPVVMLAGERCPDKIKEARLLRASAWLSKYAKPEALKHVVDMVLNTSK